MISLAVCLLFRCLCDIFSITSYFKLEVAVSWSASLFAGYFDVCSIVCRCFVLKVAISWFLTAGWLFQFLFDFISMFPAFSLWELASCCGAWGAFGVILSAFGCSGSILGGLLGRFGVFLGCFWALLVLGRSWNALGALLAVDGMIWSIWCDLGVAFSWFPSLFAGYFTVCLIVFRCFELEVAVSWSPSLFASYFDVCLILCRCFVLEVAISWFL